MESIQFARGLFQLFAFGLFVYQLQNSIGKYISGPIVQQTSTTTFDEIKKPFIYFCQHGQFDYDTARDIGYHSNTDFTTGIVKGKDGFSWNGKDGNLSFKEVQNKIFCYDYTNVKITHSVKGDRGTWESPEIEKFKIVTYGSCLKILQTNRETTVLAIEPSALYIVDSSSINKFNMNVNKEKAYFGPVDKKYFEYKTYEVKIMIHNQNIHDGVKCLNYERIGSSYAECYGQEFKKMLLDLYGCLPPWFKTNSNLTCKDGSVIMVANETKVKIYDQLHKFVNGREMDFLELCLPPCLSMSFQLTELWKLTTRLDDAKINFRIKDEVTVHTDVYSYDIFSLVVDLESSLGLWLGLSAFSIFDTLVELFLSARRKYNH